MPDILAGPKINIKGGNYRATDTADGYHIIHDVPLVSEWKKGDHGAPYDGTAEVLQEFVQTAQNRYSQGNFCATAYKRHNPDIPIDHPDFLGYVLPKRVGKYTLETGEKATIFGDIKISNDGFEQARTGKIPYVSVEIPWEKRRIRGLSFQDTLPPQYEYALFTTGEVVKDATAKFQVIHDVGKFMADDESKEDNEMSDEKIAKYVDANIGKHIEKYLDGNLKKHLEKITPLTQDPNIRKPDALPAEPNKEGGKMTNLDPEFAAKFAAQANDLAELKGKFAESEGKEKVKALMAKADGLLFRKIMLPEVRDTIIMKFAADSLSMNKGEEWFLATIEKLKPSLRDKPPANIAEFQAGALPAVDPGDPVVAKFVQKNPQDMEHVTKFAAQWAELKRALGDRFNCTQENFITNELGRFKAIRNGEIQDMTIKGGN